MVTQAQINANRQNAKRSTGPKTTKGKHVAAKNSSKHGLTAQYSVIATEDQAEFDQYRGNFLEELSPDTPMESMLAERIINLSWRLKRTGRIQNQTIDAMNSPNEHGQLINRLEESLFKKYDQSPADQDIKLGQLAIKDFSNNRVLERLLMYERRIESSLYKTVVEYQRLMLLKGYS